jgi:hypothetical protein
MPAVVANVAERSSRSTLVLLAKTTTIVRSLVSANPSSSPYAGCTFRHRRS